MRRFLSDRKGNIAVIFAIALVPVIGAMGAAIDYSMANSYRTNMQKSLDATGLALAKIMPAPQDVIDQQAHNFFTANFGEHTLTNLQITATPNIVDGTIQLIAQGIYKPQIADILNLLPNGAIGPVQLRTSTNIRWARTNLEVALAFDLSSSMAAASSGLSKVEAAKEAATELIDILFEAAGGDDPERLKISIVPYTSTVNVGTQYRHATWLDQNGLSSAHWAPSSGTVGGNITKPPVGQGVNSRFDLFDWLGEAWGGCVESRPGAFALNDAAPNVSTPNSLFVPYFAPDEPGPLQGTIYGNSYKRWLNSDSYRAYNSYLADEDQPDTICGTMPSSTSNANWTAVQKRWCKYKINGAANKKSFYVNSWGVQTGPNFMCNPTPLQRLTTSKSTLQTKISQLQALGDTSIFEGVAWAWRTISPHAPFADGRPYGTDDNMKIIVLLTDGNNNWLQLGNTNRSLHAAQGYYQNERLGSTAGMNQTQANTFLDATTVTVCQNAKQAGVIIYSVVLSLEGQEIPQSWKDLVTACASEQNGVKQAFFAQGAAQLKEIFKVIAGRISKLHIYG